MAGRHHRSGEGVSAFWKSTHGVTRRFEGALIEWAYPGEAGSE